MFNILFVVLKNCIYDVHSILLINMIRYNLAQMSINDKFKTNIFEIYSVSR